MNCEETRKRLARYSDRELGHDELSALEEHLADCKACRIQYDDQGALDMLLKSCFSPQPPTETMDLFWPTLSERLQDGGGSAGALEEITFQASAAMKALNIPEPAARARPEAVATAAAAASEPAHAPPPQASPWRWPIALVASAAIVVAGLLVYQNRQTDLNRQAMVATAPGPGQDEMRPAGAPGEGDEGGPVAVALAPGEGNAGTEEGAAGPAGEPPAPAGDEAAPPAAGEGAADQPPAGASEGDKGEEREHGKAPAKRKSKKERAEEGKANQPAAAEKAQPADKPQPAVAAKPAAKPAKGGGDMLDSLIDDALGDKEAKATVKKDSKKEPEKAAGSDLPDQLNMNQIRASMNKVKGLVQSCYDQYQVEGEAKVKLTILPDGSSKDLEVKGKFFGTDTGACVIKAVAKASFPKFGGKPMTIKYPFILQ